MVYIIWPILYESYMNHILYGPIRERKKVFDFFNYAPNGCTFFRLDHIKSHGVEHLNLPKKACPRLNFEKQLDAMDS